MVLSTLIPSPCISHPSHNFFTRNNNEMLLLIPRVVSFRMIFNYKFVKVWLEVPEIVKCQRSYLLFKNALSQLCLVL